MVVGKGSLPHAVPHSAVITVLWRNGLGSFYCGAGGMHGGKWLCISDQERPAGRQGSSALHRSGPSGVSSVAKARFHPVLGRARLCPWGL